MRKAGRMAVNALCIAVLSACGGGGDSGGPATQLPDSGHSFTNPLNLSPAPQFSTSTRTVNYDDCFPKWDDIEVGDVVKSTVETYTDAAGIGVIDQTETVTSVVQDTFADRDSSVYRNALRVKTDNPPYLRSDNVMQFGVRTEALILRGGTVTLLREDYLNDADGTRMKTKNVPSKIGDLAAAHIYTPFAMRDSVAHAYAMSFTNIWSPEFDHQADITEKIMFIGVEEGTEVPAGKFEYSCVFRREFKSVINGETITNVQDYYTTKWSGVKAITYSPDYPRPLLYKLVSNSAIERRKAAH